MQDNVYSLDDGAFVRLVSVQCEMAKVQLTIRFSEATMDVPFASLKPQGRHDMLAPEELLKRAIRLLDDPEKWGGEPNREVWTVVLTHTTGYAFTATFPQWIVDDEELLVLAIKCEGLRHQLWDGLQPFPSKSGRVLPKPVSEVVLVEMARRNWEDLLRFVIPDERGISLELKLFEASPVAYKFCRESLRVDYALDMIKRADERMYKELRFYLPVEKRVDYDRKMCIKLVDTRVVKDAGASLHDARVEFTKHVLGRRSMSVKGWSAKVLQEACIEVGEFHGEAAATFLRNELKRRSFRIFNYPEETLRFLGANLPTEDARELAMEAASACRKRDRRDFEAMWSPR